jgi:hypothetical protein
MLPADAAVSNKSLHPIAILLSLLLMAPEVLEQSTSVLTAGQVGGGGAAPLQRVHQPVRQRTHLHHARGETFAHAAAGYAPASAAVPAA